MRMHLSFVLSSFCQRAVEAESVAEWKSMPPPVSRWSASTMSFITSAVSAFAGGGWWSGEEERVAACVEERERENVIVIVIVIVIVYQLVLIVIGKVGR